MQQRSSRLHPFAAMLVASLIVFFPGNASSGAPKPIQDITDRLKQVGVEPTRASIQAYVRSLFPTAKQQAHVTAIIRQLGDKSFQKRKNASHELSKLLGSPWVVKRLREALKSPDPEIRFRATTLVQRADRLSSSLRLRDVFQIIAARRIKGLTEEVLSALASVDDTDTLAVAHQALVATVSRDDVPERKKATASPHVAARVAALEALSDLDHKAALPYLRKALKSSEESVQLIAANLLLRKGDRSALPVLARILRTSSPDVTRSAVWLLRQATGQSFSYRASRPGATTRTTTQKQSIDQWVKWIKKQGKTAPIQPIEAHTHRIEVSAWIDGTDSIHVHGHTLWYQHHAWQHPKGSTMINGRAWRPKWFRRTSDPWMLSDRALPGSGKVKVAIEKSEGRGAVTIRQQPSRENDYVLIVRFDDGREGGMGYYKVTIEWKEE